MQTEKKRNQLYSKLYEMKIDGKFELQL